VPLDLSVAGIEESRLVTAGFSRTERTFWIAEGLLMYLREEIVRSLMRTLHGLSSAGSAFAFTFMEKQSDGSIGFPRQSKLVDWWLRRRGEPFLWGATQNGLTELARPWRITRFFDHHDFLALEPTLSSEPLARGELICLAEF
jgi:O-methyltransferase involved in polyketide biosynthesis